MNSRLSRVFWLLGGSLLGFVILALLKLGVRLWPGCLWHQVTGWHCPGCGGTRALRALMGGELGLAFAQNPFFVLLLPVACSFLAWNLLVWCMNKPSRRWLPPVWVWGLLGILLLLFGLLRNLEGFECLGPPGGDQT